MPVSVRDARRSDRDRRWIEGVYREYLDDLSPPDTGLFPVLGEIGHREPDQLMRWFADSSAHALLILYSGEPVGFAMVARAPDARTDALPRYRMAEFFIRSGHRRLGIGASAVQLILDRFAGRWEIMEYARNPGAVAFWRRVVSRYTGGQHRERVSNGEVRQTFTSGSRR